MVEKASKQAAVTQESELTRFHGLSPVGKWLERAFWYAQWVSVPTWKWGPQSKPKYPDRIKDRTRWVEAYLLCGSIGLWVVLAIWEWWTPCHRWPYSLFAWFLFSLGVWRVLDIFQSQVNAHLFDCVRAPGGNEVASIVRSTFMAGWNYLELIGWFATFYLWEGSIPAIKGAFDALYFSTITQLTVGFGDIAPQTQWARALTMVQGLSGTLILVIAIARFISGLPKVEQFGERDTEAERIANAVVAKLKTLGVIPSASPNGDGAGEQN